MATQLDGGRADIGGFSIATMRNLGDTIGPGDDFRPIMACHGSAPGAETPCAGYLVVEGWSNLAVRMGVIEGRIDMSSVVEAAEGLDLWGSFDEMLEAYEKSQPEGDRVLRARQRCVEPPSA